MSETTPTVMIKGKGGHPLRINADEYDRKKHGPLHGENGEEPAQVGEVQSLPDGMRPPPAPAAVDVGLEERPDIRELVQPDTPAPNQLLVAKDRNRFHVMGQDGNAFQADGIDPKGYKTEKEAWDAILVYRRSQPH